MHAGGHANGAGTNGNLITWNSNGQGEASAWYIVQVDDIDLTLNAGGDGKYYATLCLPFAVTLEGATAYTLEKNGTMLTQTPIEDVVPAGTAVLLVGQSEKATATITDDSSAAIENDLTGSYLKIDGFDGAKNYVLGKDDTKVGFFHWKGTTLAANRAYIAGVAQAQVKGFYLNNDTPTGVPTLENILIL